MIQLFKISEKSAFLDFKNFSLNFWFRVSWGEKRTRIASPTVGKIKGHRAQVPQAYT